MKYLVGIVLFLIFISTPPHIFADDTSSSSNNQFITIVNPVRVSSYNPDTRASIERQRQILIERAMPATWLFTYDVLNLPGIHTFKNESLYEIGLWLEVTPDLAKDAGVLFVQSDSWHRAKSIFLSGYLPSDRLKLIDTVFAKYHQVYGYYPTSIGAWWVDSFSLDYIQQKYHVTANLGVADQFSTDGYHVWGQYWAAPFYPAKYHTGLPAPALNQKIDIVNLQWAPRDPIHGYGQDKASLFSSQDYYTIGLDSDYLQQLIQIYTNQGTNGFGQFTIGLEGDMSPESYLGQYSKILDAIKDLSQKNNYQLTNMSQFASWYRKTFPNLTPPYLTISKDLLGKEEQSIWYQSPQYRINLLFNKSNRTLTIRDLRVYPAGLAEPYFSSPNTELDLYINVPSVIDSASNLEESWSITDVDLQIVTTASALDLQLGNNRTLTLQPDKIKISNMPLPDIIQKSPLLEQSASNTLTFNKKWPYGAPGYSFTQRTIEADFYLQTKKIQLLIISYGVLALIIGVLVLRSNKPRLVKLLILTILLAIPFIVFYAWSARNSTKYSISNDEINALQKLSSLPDGRVVLYDKYCLQCQWTTEHKPAAFANKRGYITELSRKPIVYSKQVFEAATRAEAKSALDNLNAKYIYTVKYDNYLETPPFSPGDLGITKIFENASSQIWQVKR